MRTHVRLDGTQRRCRPQGNSVTYPDGISTPWNDGRHLSLGPNDLTNVSRVGFVDALLDEVTADGPHEAHVRCKGLR